MKRLVYLLATCLSFAARADDLAWQRNNGVWEKVVRVSRGVDYVSHGFRCATNGIVTRYFPHQEETNVQWRVDYDYYSRHSGNSIGAERKLYTWRLFGLERIYPVPDPMAWTNDMATVAWRTNHFAEICANDNGNQRYVYTAWTVIRTNIVDVTPRPRTGEGKFPCRLGVPSSIVVTPPYDDLLDLLPLSYPETTIRVKVNFNGYLLLRFFDDDNRLQIRRLLPERLPYEQKPRNMLILRDDALNGV